MLAFLSLLSVLRSVCAQSAVYGTLLLDNVTFSKIVGRDYDTFVKFDKQYPYGDEQDEWKKLAVTTRGASSLILASVGVSEYGDKENDDLRERFNVKVEAFPKFFFFKKGAGTKNPTIYDGAAKEMEMARWLMDKAGIYIGLPGQLQDFDVLAKGFVNKGAEEQAEMVKQSEALLAGTKNSEEQDYGKFYVRVMKKIVAEGKDFLKTEEERIKRIMSGKLKPEKKDSFAKRLNILPSFKAKTEL
eukprot:gb/GEZN01012491.1/.p1 GENE.gb/GEZN01012491.1/~~gb/GEZN01012491.1/.p1  ORF type:complete len:244 (+),score=51.73 gb/GEZN01012491.1/:149-880(+)